MAGVIIDAKICRQPAVVAMLGAKVVKEPHRFIGGLQEAERFRLQPKVEASPRVFADLGDVLNAGENIGLNLPDLLRRGDELLERTRHRAHAPLHSSRHELSQQIEQAICIIDAILRRPIRQIDLLFDALAVETAVGESVDCKNIAIIPVQPVAKGQQGRRLA